MAIRRGSTHFNIALYSISMSPRSDLLISDLKSEFDNFESLYESDFVEDWNAFGFAFQKAIFFGILNFPYFVNYVRAS